MGRQTRDTHTMHRETQYTHPQSSCVPFVDTSCQAEAGHPL